MLNSSSQNEVGRRWHSMATLELEAELLFTRLAQKMAKCGVAPVLTRQVREFIVQERDHFNLCADLSERFGVPWSSPDQISTAEVSPSEWSLHDRVLYEVVAFSCVAETVNCCMISVGQEETDDSQALRATNKILADEIHHARIGWQFLDTHPIDDNQAKWLSFYLPVMIEGAMGSTRFQPDSFEGNEDQIVSHGGTRRSDGRSAFLDGVRSIVLPGLSAIGIDVEPGYTFIDGVERQARLKNVAIS